MTESAEDTIDAIRGTLVDWYSETLDLQGPNFLFMARKVYEEHVAPLEHEVSRYYERSGDSNTQPAKGITQAPREIARSRAIEPLSETELVDAHDLATALPTDPESLSLLELQWLRYLATIDALSAAAKDADEGRNHYMDRSLGWMHRTTAAETDVGRLRALLERWLTPERDMSHEDTERFGWKRLEDETQTALDETSPSQQGDRYHPDATGSGSVRPDSGSTPHPLPGAGMFTFPDSPPFDKGEMLDDLLG